ncbi:hypothetical protein FQN54_009303 [Arachnomyces sp. PD_36]|nr:hypothetical protein FQN54_009303 [Arachnomyces sp. PD_36]
MKKTSILEIQKYIFEHIINIVDTLFNVEIAEEIVHAHKSQFVMNEIKIVE